jgi:PEP-CTERM motif-containing protein
MDFDSPVSYVEVSQTFWSSDDVRLYAFDAAFNPISSTPSRTCLRGFACGGGPDGPHPFYEQYITSITSPDAEIEYVIAASWDEGWATIDTIRFQPGIASVPEPSALLLVGVGMATMALRRREAWLRPFKEW